MGTGATGRLRLNAHPEVRHVNKHASTLVIVTPEGTQRPNRAGCASGLTLFGGLLDEASSPLALGLPLGQYKLLADPEAPRPVSIT